MGLAESEASKGLQRVPDLIDDIEGETPFACLPAEGVLHPGLAGLITQTPAVLIRLGQAAAGHDIEGTQYLFMEDCDPVGFG